MLGEALSVGWAVLGVRVGVEGSQVGWWLDAKGELGKVEAPFGHRAFNARGEVGAWGAWGWEGGGGAEPRCRQRHVPPSAYVQYSRSPS